MRVDQLSLRRKSGMEAVDVGRRVETVELRDLQAFQPCDVQVLHDVMRREVAGVEAPTIAGSALLRYAPHTGSYSPSWRGIAASQVRAAATASSATPCVT